MHWKLRFRFRFKIALLLPIKHRIINITVKSTWNVNTSTNTAMHYHGSKGSWESCGIYGLLVCYTYSKYISTEVQRVQQKKNSPVWLPTIDHYFEIINDQGVHYYKSENSNAYYKNIMKMVWIHIQPIAYYILIVVFNRGKCGTSLTCGENYVGIVNSFDAQGKSGGFDSCDRPSNLKLDLNRRFFSPCDLEIWWMTLKNNRAPVLCYFLHNFLAFGEYKLELQSGNT